MKGVFDTNILVDSLSGEIRAAAIISNYADKIISRITWAEVLVGAKTPSDEANVRTFLEDFRIAEVSVAVAESAVQIRRATPRLKLPDAIIYATAKDERCELLTRDLSAFSASNPDIIVPYTI